MAPDVQHGRVEWPGFHMGHTKGLALLALLLSLCFAATPADVLSFSHFFRVIFCLSLHGFGSEKAT